MRDEEIAIRGKIITSQLAYFGDTEIIYGYITIDIDRNEHVDVKVDSYTQYETLDTGSHVVIEAARLGESEILVAKRILLQQISDLSPRSESLIATS